MVDSVAWRTRLGPVLGLLLGLLGCASTPGRASAPASAASEPAGAQQEGPGPRPADAATDAAYYRDHAAALQQPVPKLDPAMDFKRLRRGRLYSDVVQAPPEVSKALRTALETDDAPGIIEATQKLLAADPMDLRARLILSVVLHTAGRAAESDAHRAVAKAQLDSITHGGDGRSVRSAWVVYQVQEEYGLMDASGYQVESQSLRQDSSRSFDVLRVKERKTGETIEAYFDITELFAEEARALSGP